jgi:hypothetical protein
MTFWIKAKFDPNQIRVLLTIWWRSLLACSINIRGGVRGAINTRLHGITWNPSCHLHSAKHQRAVLHPCTCGLCRGATVVAVALIGYDDVKVAAEMTTARRRSWSITSSTLTRDYVGSLLQLFFRCSACIVVTIHDLILASILGWHGRSSASVVYLKRFSGIRAILCSSWSGSYDMVICDDY